MASVIGTFAPSPLRSKFARTVIRLSPNGNLVILSTGLNSPFLQQAEDNTWVIIGNHLHKN